MNPPKLLWFIYGHTYDGLLRFYPYRELVNEVVKTLDVHPAETVLDLGCGTGNQLNAVKDLTSAQLIGVDASRSMVRIAREKLANRGTRNSVKIHEADVVALLSTLPSKSIDKIMSTNVVYALKDRDKFWNELMRVLKPNGVAVIATSISTDSKPLIRDQLEHEGLVKSLHPRLLGVFLCDAVINLFGQSGHFEFPKAQTLSKEVEAAGGTMSIPRPCYSGIDIIFEVKHRLN